jgi:hypothetical protein
MSLQTNLQNLTTRIATEIKALRTLINGNVADLSALTTSVKTNLVAAINSLVTVVSGKADAVHTHTVSQLSDASANARSFLQAANYAAMKLLLSLTKADVGLGNVDNTADTAKPVSTLQQAALDLKVPLTYLDTDTTLAANSDTKIATQKATKAYVDALLAAADAMVFKGVIAANTNPNYPAANKGDTYRISVAGKIGGASGPNVEVGDVLLSLADGQAAGNHATVGANWSILQTNIDGAVIGPSAAVTDGNVAVFDGTSGRLLKERTFAQINASLNLGDMDTNYVTLFEAGLV